MLVTDLMRDKRVGFFLAMSQHQLFIAHNLNRGTVSHDQQYWNHMIALD